MSSMQRPRCWHGLKLALNVAAMLLAFIALIALANSVIGGLGGLVGFEGLTLERFLAMSWLIRLAYGCAMERCDVGQLLGIKTVVNEFVAYMGLSGQFQNGTIENPRSTSSLFMRSAASPTLVPLPYRLAASAVLRSPVAKTWRNLACAP